ncbi:DUF6494 family protein [Paraburkholderia sp. JHI869]|uniref:DUF6494 family protein n=1 Tax=Paraburkholderia sp. JHI869 TaxID=3112959 RepID=UPI003171CE25
MNDDVLNLSIRTLLKTFGIHAQRTIEQAVTKAIADGTVAGTETFPVKVTLDIAGLRLNAEFSGEVRLQ